MAKRPSYKPDKPDSDPLASTQPEGASHSGAGAPTRRRRQRIPDDPIQSKGVGLRTSEWRRLEAIADQEGLSTPDTTGTHELSAWILRDFIARYGRGEVTLPKRTVTKSVLD